MQSNHTYIINVSSPLTFNRTGKLEAHSTEWHHETSSLHDYELIVVTEGTLYLQFQDQKYTVVPGQYLLLQPSYSGHQTTENLRRGFQQSKCSFYWLHFSCSYVFPLDPLRTNTLTLGRNDILIPVHKSLPYPDRVLLLMRQLQNCVRSHYDTTYEDYMTTLILCEIANQLRTSLQPVSSPQTAAAPQKQLYHDIVDYVNYYIHTNLKVADIARHFGYNEKYISRFFKEASGVTLKQYILSQKIERANFLLSDTNISVSEIAASLDFSDYHNFAHTYRRMMSMSPTEYRTLYSKRIVNHD